MRRILLALVLCVINSSLYAQKITHSFNGVPLSEALKTIETSNRTFTINFVYDELEDFTVTTNVVKQTVPDAIRQIIGFYPIRMTIDSTDIFVDCIHKTERKLIGKVVDEKGQPLEFANITLLNPSDSTFITGGVSNVAGDFVIPCDVTPAIVKFTFVGYKTIERRMNMGNVGSVSMQPDQHLLKTVTVEAAREINLVDRQLLIPSKEMVKHSSDGYELLQKMNVNGLMVDPIQRSVKSLSGGEVQIRINDVKATSSDLLSLMPDEVIRIENIMNPGVRYSENGLDNVINFVVRRRYSGYVGGVSTRQALEEGFNNSYTYFKYNYKLSEFSLDYSFNYRDYNERRNDDQATYLFPDGTSRMRNYIGQNTRFTYYNHSVRLGYNLTKPDKYVLNAKFLLNAFLCPRRGNNHIAEETGMPDLYIFNKREQNSVTPSFDVYYSVNLLSNQRLDVNLVGTNISTDYHYFMQQYLYTGDAETSMEKPALDDYSYSTDGNKYSLIGEAIYTKQFTKLNLSSGMYYDLGYANNKYTGANDLDAQLHTNNFYAFAQIQGTLKKVNYQLGLGTKRVYAHQGDLGYSRWTVRPQLSLSTDIAKNFSVNYTFNIAPNTPSLADLTSVRQQNNDLTGYNGNSDLKPYNEYNNRLSISWYAKYVKLNARYSYVEAPDIIMENYAPELQSDGSYMIIVRMMNQKSYKQHALQMFATVSPIPDCLSFSGFAMYDKVHSLGTDYSHQFSHWTFGGMASLMLKKWDVSYEFSTQPRWFVGETESGGERTSSLELNYRNKGFQFGIGCLLLGYAQGFDYKTITTSKYYKSNSPTYIKDNGNMVYLNFRCDFSYGRKYKTGNRTLQNSDNESGIK